MVCHRTIATLTIAIGLSQASLPKLEKQQESARTLQAKASATRTRPITAWAARSRLSGPTMTGSHLVRRERSFVCVRHETKEMKLIKKRRVYVSARTQHESKSTRPRAGIGADFRSPIPPPTPYPTQSFPPPKLSTGSFISLSRIFRRTLVEFNIIVNHFVSRQSCSDGESDQRTTERYP